MDQRLDRNADAALAGSDRGAQRFFAREMDDVGRGTGELGERHQVMHALGFDRGRAALMVLAGISLAGSEQLLAAFGDERFVLAVGGDDDAELLRELERAIELGVVDAEGPLVGEEDFEGGDAALHDLAELGRGGVVEFRHAHVEREVARALSDGLRHPELEGLQRVVFARGTAHLDQRGRATDECGL